MSPQFGHAQEIGLGLDVGIPEGVASTLEVRLGRFRVQAGPSYNALNQGALLGASFSLRQRGITPTFSFRTGKLFSGNANKFLKDMIGDSFSAVPALENFSYSHASARFGIEFLSEHLCFFLRMGLSAAWTNIDAAQQTLNHQIMDENDLPLDANLQIRSAPEIHARFVSASLGMAYFY